MLQPDYAQCAEDHQKVLVLIRKVGEFTDYDTFKAVFESVVNNHELTAVPSTGHDVGEVHSTVTPGSASGPRTVWARYIDWYPTENNAWGEFQAHRQLLGVICVGSCRNMEEAEALFRSYEYQKEQYSRTVLDCRLIVLIVNESVSPTSTEVPGRVDAETGEIVIPVPNMQTADNSQSVGSDTRDDSPSLQETFDLSYAILQELVPEWYKEVILVPINGNLPSNLLASTLNTGLRDMLIAIYCVLDSRRINRGFRDSSGSFASSQGDASVGTKFTAPLMAPFERREMVGLDTESRQFQRKCLGREKKHLADLCLQCGLPGEALLHYQTGLDLLKQTSDWLWVAAALEGLCAASVAIHYGRGSPVTQLVNKNLASPAAFRRIASESTVRGVAGHNRSSSARRDSLVEKQEQQQGLDTLATNQIDVSQSLDLATLHRVRNYLQPEDIVRKYEEAMDHYRKYGMASIIALEAAIKACRVLIKQEKRLKAAKFLEEVVFLGLQSTDDEQIRQYNTLADLYRQIGFRRKAAFYKMYAGNLCATRGGFCQPRPRFDRMRSYLLEACVAIGMGSDPMRWPRPVESGGKSRRGWPILHVQFLKDLVSASIEMNRHDLVMWYVLTLVDGWYPWLPPGDMVTYVGNLWASISRQRAAKVLKDVAVPVWNLPRLESVRACPLPGSLQPVRCPLEGSSLAKPKAIDYGPFIYSPLMVNKKIVQKKHETIYWIKGQPCEVVLTFSNPLSTELHIRNLVLLTTSSSSEAGESNECELLTGSMPGFTLPPLSPPVPLKMTVTPSKTGRYYLSSCRYHIANLADLVCSPVHNFHVSLWLPTCETIPELVVVEELPRLKVQLNLPSSDSFVLTQCDKMVATASLELFTGEHREFPLTLVNTSVSCAVDHISIVTEDSVRNEFGLGTSGKVPAWLTFSEDNLKAQLPLRHSTGTNDGTARACITFYADANSFKSVGVQKSGEATETLLTVCYTDTAGQSVGYWRQLSIVISTELSAAITLIGHRLTNDLDLALTLANVTNQKTEIHVTWQQSECLPEPLVLLPGAEREVTLGLLLAEEWRRCSSAAGVDDVASLSQWISVRLGITWRMPDLGRRGLVPTEELAWSEADLWRLRLDDAFSFVLKEISLGNSDSVELQVGQPLRITLICSINKLASLAGIDLSRLLLRSQVSWEERRDYGVDLTDICSIGGQDFVRGFDSLDSTQLQFTIIFFQSGVFSLAGAVCFYYDDATLSESPLVTLKSSEPIRVTVESYI